MDRETEERYKIEKPADWAPQLSDEEILAAVAESDFSRAQHEEGRDFCYFLKKTEYTDDTQNAEYTCMAYSVQQPDTMEVASVQEHVLHTAEHMVIHRISVLRDGVLIDKLPDTRFKVLDNEDQSMAGVINSSKKVNITIKDIRLYDILLVEDTHVVTFTDKDFLRKELIKYLWVSPNVYWAYGTYQLDFINRRSKPVAYKKLFFRDQAGELLPVETGVIAPGDRYSLRLENYLNPVDESREVYPYIDFATDHSYGELIEFVRPYYHSALTAKSIQEYAPDLVAKLDALGEDLDAKIVLGIEYVQNSIRYIYNEEEMHGHKPQDPWVTCTSRQGDCKAKTVLLKCVMDYLGVDSEIVLVNYQADFHIRYYLPSLFNFNHVVLKISHKGGTYFEDATCRDEYGTLGNRSFIGFMHYLPIRPDAALQRRETHTSPEFAIFDDVSLSVRDNVGHIAVRTTYRYSRANHMRRYFKNTNRKAILDEWNNFIFSCLDLAGENGNDKRQVFADAQIQVVEDDNVNNVFVVGYSASINDPYHLGKDGKKYLKYYDSNIVKGHLKDYLHKDLGFLQCFDSEKYKITIRSDQPINTKDEFTQKELDLNHKYFTYRLTKNVDRYGATAEVEFVPLCNVDVPVSDIPELRDRYAEVEKSAFGLGVAISKPQKTVKWVTVLGIAMAAAVYFLLRFWLAK